MNIRTKRRVCLIVAVVLLSTCFVAYARFFKGYTTMQAVTFFLAPSPRELCRLGEPITRSIESYFQRHGRYPSSLFAADIDAAETFFGPWEYWVSDDLQSCELAVGDYGRYLFVVSWSPGNGWYIDT